jgi:hypothetical protein
MMKPGTPSGFFMYALSEFALYAEHAINFHEFIPSNLSPKNKDMSPVTGWYGISRGKRTYRNCNTYWKKIVTLLDRLVY